MENSKLYSIYGARMSKDGKRVNVSIVTGSDEDKTFGTISIKLNDKKVKLSKDKKFVYVKVKMLAKSDKKAIDTDKTESKDKADLF